MTKVEATVARQRDLVPEHLAARGFDGSDASSEEAKCSLFGNLLTSPTIPMIFAARIDPMPKTSVRVVPEASTSSRMHSSKEATFRSRTRTSHTNSEASHFRVRPAAWLGRARLLSEKRVGFLIMAFGLALYLAVLVVGTSEGIVVMAVFAVRMLALGLGASALWIKLGTKRVSRQARGGPQ
jgi:hypothetical protein